MLCGDRQNPVVVCWAAQEIHRDDRRHTKPLPRSLSQDSFEENWIQAPRLLLDVNEDGSGPRVCDGEGRRSESEGGNDDLIAGLDVQAQQRKMNGGRTRRKGKGMPSAGESTDVLLEPVDLGAKGRHPSGRDRSCQSLHLKVGHVCL